MEGCCNEECYENTGCKDIKIRIFLICAAIVILAFLSYSIYLVTRAPICTRNDNEVAHRYYRYRPTTQPKCAETSIKLYPQVAAIIDKNLQMHICSGVIVSANWMITAAHCLIFCKKETCNNFDVRAGSSHANRGGNIYSIIHFEVHPKFDPANLENDIGLIKVQSFNFSGNNIKAAKISSMPMKTGQQAELLGWFSYSTVDVIYRDNTLRKTKLRIYSDVICKYRMKGTYNKFALTESMLCGIYPTTSGGCYTDPGGPFMANGEIKAVAMFGQNCYSCDSQISILTDIYYFRDFIKNVTAIEGINLAT